MTIEEEVGDIVSKALKVRCEFRNVSDYGHVSTDYIYPLPQVGDVMHFQLEDNDWQVVSRRHVEVDYSWETGGWILMVKELKDKEDEQ
jgi:hypothetical protein